MPYANTSGRESRVDVCFRRSLSTRIMWVSDSRLGDAFSFARGANFKLASDCVRHLLFALAPRQTDAHARKLCAFAHEPFGSAAVSSLGRAFQIPPLAHRKFEQLISQHLWVRVPFANCKLSQAKLFDKWWNSPNDETWSNILFNGINLPDFCSDPCAWIFFFRFWDF